LAAIDLPLSQENIIIIMEEITNQADVYLNVALEYAQIYGLKVLGAIVALFIGLRIIKWIVRSVEKVMERADVDASLRPFLTSLIGTLLKVMLAISIMGMLGIEMTSFIAILAAAGLAVGMALSGTLQNFAGGVIILIFKPFKVGDVIEAQGYTGSVREIQIFVTILNTPDNKTIIIPNGGLSNGSMINYSTQENRRVDWTFGIGYGDDVQKARGIIKGLIDADTRIHQDPAPAILLASLGDSSVNLTVRVWANAADYWGIFFEMNENVYNHFNKAGINIPFPQMDVHLKKED
jgi:small conductance mechanosensitive channel